MHVLRIEHAVPDYDAWKRMFDSDPLDRKGSGVRAHRVMRASDKPDLVMIDLEFESAAEADAMHAKLTELWGRVDVMRDPEARVVEVAERESYR